MFAAPPAVVAEVFAEIPVKYRRRAASSHWIDVQFPGQEIPSFLEGPCFDAAGNLWVVDIPWGRLFRISAAGEVSLEMEYDGHPNGLKFLADGRALIADGQNGLMLFDPARGTIEPHVARDLLEPFLGLNDLTVARSGDVWFTDMGLSGLQNPNGKLYKLSADGRLECMLDGLPSPNGLVLNKAETVLFLACTRANAVWKCPIMPDGSLRKVGVFVQLSGGTSGPDGLAIDEDDNLVVCHNGFGAVWVFSAIFGEPKLRINSPRGIYTTNCAFGGPGNRSLFITESQSGTILKVDLEVAGRRLHPPVLASSR
ncbi:SMP-30/gluconolactonase/LRE family protein [Novosphingobium sp. PS1R-30]|uniref:SMP-30/gluconolactonase/LRE family protein n=1 Tax=Novosphingobium anseongense TaxID=3133436 RepID=A0ABU8S0Q5_9SPHN